MNRDVKIGLAIGLLVLVALFVWLAVKASREPSPVADLSQKPPAGTTGPALTSTQTPDKTGVVSGKDYFSPEESPKIPESGELAMAPVTKTPESKGTATVEVGTQHTTSAGEMTAAARYRELTQTRKAGESALKTEEFAPKTGETGTLSPGFTPGTVEAPKTPSNYVVKEGDTLGIISKKVYGSSHFWQRIAKANKIDDPARVRAGMSLTIPALSDTERPHAIPALKDRGVPPTVSLPAASAEQHHKVVAGDTLGSISQQYYGTSRKTKLIMDANKITDENKLRVGQVLVIPRLSTASSSSSSAAHASRAAVGGEYVVRNGDTLESISQQFYGTSTLYPVIMKANKIDNGRDVLMGQKLIIPPRPAGGETAEESPRTPTPVAVAPKELSKPKLAPGEETYVVEEGDTLGDIAARQLGSARQVGLLMKRNNLTGEGQVHIGQVLIIPSRTALHVASSEARETTPR